MAKEQNFISVVIYLHNNAGKVKPFFNNLSNELDKYFDKYELIVVNASCTDTSLQELEECGMTKYCPLTVIHMSKLQDREACMNAGLDISIGDFVYEFDSIENQFPWDYVYQAYETALKGHDVVTISPSKVGGANILFYTLFNAYSHTHYKIRTNAFRLVSRRALHRVHAISTYMPYRKAAFAGSGLKCATLEYNGRCYEKQENRTRLAVESLLLYTQLGYQVSSILSVAMVVVTLCAFMYAIAIYCMGTPVAGWTTLTLLISFGFAGLFLGNTIAIKYLALLLEFRSRRERYLIESIEKLEKNQN